MKFPVKKSEYIFEKGWLRIRSDTLQNDKGEVWDYPVIEVKPVAAVLGFDEENHMILQREYRPTLRKVVVETSCGGMESNEDPFVAAAREFKEETGHEINHLEKVGVWNVLTGKCAVEMHMFIGRVAGKASVQKLDSFESIQPFRVPAKEAVSMVLHGEITNAEHIALILVAKEKHPEWFA